jgi:hypothetical protein
MQVARKVVARVRGRGRGDGTVNKKCEKSGSFQDHSNYQHGRGGELRENDLDSILFHPCMKLSGHLSSSVLV